MFVRFHASVGEENEPVLFGIRHRVWQRQAGSHRALVLQCKGFVSTQVLRIFFSTKEL